MYLIDATYFYAGPLAIENANGSDDENNNSAAVCETIDAYIERYQPEFLTYMVGESVASLITAHLAKTDEDGDEYDADYEDSDADELCSWLRLAFAHYVYYMIVRDANQQMTATGLVKLKCANENQPPRQRMVRVWNEMVELNKRFIVWAKTDSCGYSIYYYPSMITPINQYNI